MEKQKICVFVKKRGLVKDLNNNKISLGFFMTHVIGELWENFDAIEWTVDDVEFLQMKLRGKIFRPLLFIQNLVMMGMSLRDLLDHSCFYSVFDEATKCSTHLIYTMFLCLKTMFHGLICETRAIRGKSAMDQKCSDVVFWSDGKLVNCMANIGIFTKYLIGPVEDKDRVEDDPFFVLEPDNKKRSEMMLKGFLYEKVDHVELNCGHVDEENIKRERPVILNYGELQEEEREVYVVNENRTEAQKKEEKDFKNGTKNALSILHFIDYYRDSWGEVEHIYVIGVASNPHLISVADFFYDKEVHYIDPRKFRREFFGNRKNVTRLRMAIDASFSFLPNSVLISDIRSDPDDEGVHKDNELQMKWSVHPNVLFGTYKFRYPYEKKVMYNIEYDYIFLQAYKGSRSNETRMYISKKEKEKVFLDSQEAYDEKICYFNNHHRFSGRACNDCRVRDYILKKFVCLPSEWARLFGMLVDSDLTRLFNMAPCECIEIGKKFLSPCEYCNWKSVNVGARSIASDRRIDKNK
jgi:hypothetical protein